MFVKLDLASCDVLSSLLARDPALDRCLAEIYAEQRRAFRHWFKDNIDDGELDVRMADLALRRETAIFKCLKAVTMRDEAEETPSRNQRD